MTQELNFGGNEEIVENTESVGGWSADESGVQAVIVTVAYLTKSINGASMFNMETLDKNENKRRYTICISNVKGETFYTDKKTQEKRMLPGYQLVNNLCMATAGKPFKDVYAAGKDKSIDLMDWESRKEIPTMVKTFPSIYKKLVKLGVIKKIENARKGGKPTNEQREVNEIHTVFHASDNRTPKEVANKVADAVMFAKWEKYWVGRTKDEFKPVEATEEQSSGVDPFGADTSDSVDPFGESSDKEETSTKSENSSETTSEPEPDVTEDEDDVDPFA
jgi:hypothetical protein